jgi:hypothetical protein
MQAALSSRERVLDGLPKAIRRSTDSMKITTSITKLRAAGACKPRLAVLMNTLCGSHIDLDADLDKQIVHAIHAMGNHADLPINALDILHSNGVEDILWLMDSPACHQDTAPALAEYERVTAPALAEYERVTAPALETILGGE